jgi:hypothetical protein
VHIPYNTVRTPCTMILEARQNFKAFLIMIGNSHLRRVNSVPTSTRFGKNAFLHCAGEIVCSIRLFIIVHFLAGKRPRQSSCYY